MKATPHVPVMLLAAILTFVVKPSLAASRTHIIVIVADDLGWGDVSDKDPTMYTPNLDTMLSGGVRLTNAYVNPLCSPSRAALLSGVYPFKMGMQSSVLSALKNESLPLDKELLPEKLQALGYSTHLVGKWHLGYCSNAMLPTSRGFDSFYGKYLGSGGYYSHRGYMNGYDLHNSSGLDWGSENVYSTDLFTDQAVRIIQDHDPAADPLFLMLSYQAVHTPQEVNSSVYSQYCQQAADSDRNMHCMMTAAMDKGIGRVKQALEDYNYMDNALVFFTSDNGGQPASGASNWPLRGGKGSLWEGGTRAVSFLYGSQTVLPTAPTTWDGFVHAVDWLPTLVKAAGGNGNVAGIDGMDLWERIQQGTASKRSEIVYNINEVQNTSAIRQGRFKLVINDPGNTDGWKYPLGGATMPTIPRNPDSIRLFDIKNDEMETTDIKDRNDRTRNVTLTLLQRLADLQMDLVASVDGPSFNLGKPSRNGGAWVSGWCD